MELKYGKRTVMPFTNKEKAKKFADRVKSSGKYRNVSMQKYKKIYWVGAYKKK